MPDANGYVSGKEGFVTKDGVNMPFNEWDLDFSESGLPDVSNWLTVPFSYFVGGLHKATLKLRGPYVFSRMALTNLNAYVFNLGFFVGVYLTGQFIVRLKIMNKMETNPEVEVTGKPQGAFGITIL